MEGWKKEEDEYFCLLKKFDKKLVKNFNVFQKNDQIVRNSFIVKLGETPI